jgi:hypothetical protein
VLKKDNQIQSVEIQSGATQVAVRLETRGKREQLFDAAQFAFETSK